MYYWLTLAIALAFGVGTLFNAIDTIQKQNERAVIQDLQKS